MVWLSNQKNRPEVEKVRSRVISFCRGMGLDVGCGFQKISPKAIGIDQHGKLNTIDLDAQNLYLFKDDQFDYLFSSHCLEDCVNIEKAMREWIRVIKPGGYLILYLPHEDLYPKVGTQGYNFQHLHDLNPDKVERLVKKIGKTKLLHSSIHDQDDEYSFQQIYQKTGEVYLHHQIKEFGMIIPGSKSSPLIFPRKKKGDKECLVIRYGAYGDQLIGSCIIPYLKQDGYRIVWNCTPRGEKVLWNNPNIDELLIQETDAIENTKLAEYWDYLATQFDKVINLSGSIEDACLVVEKSPLFSLNKEKRHERYNKNYYENQVSIAGYEPNGYRLVGQFFPTHYEQEWAKTFLKKHRAEFYILWAMSGSALYKAYPWTEFVMKEFLGKHKDAKIITVGDETCKLIEPDEHPQIIKKCGNLGIRESLTLSQMVNIVIGPETGILHGAATKDKVGKIIFLSHSSPENITKHWQNAIALTPDNCECAPCHQLIYSWKEICKIGETGGTLCMENISIQKTIEALEHFYDI